MHDVRSRLGKGEGKEGGREGERGESQLRGSEVGIANLSQYSHSAALGRNKEHWG